MFERGDVSFSFTDRVREIEENLRDQRFQSALALALTLPDICGGIAFPEMIKKYRDGRIMRNRSGEPSRDTGRQYIQWIDSYAAPFLKKDPADDKPYISGERCWQLRCEYLHQNRGFDNEDEQAEMHFHLGINCGSSVCNVDSESEQNGITSIRLDIQELCRRLCMAAKTYYEEQKDSKVFELYNTPVIDFIKWKEETFAQQKVLAVVVRDKVYAQGLKLAFESAYRMVVTAVSWEEIKKKLKKQKPDVWIVEECFEEQVVKEEKAERKPVVFLLRDASGKEKVPRQYECLEKTMDLREIRKKIRSAE